MRLFLFLFVAGGAAIAQQTSISGTVSDSTGAVIPEAVVRLLQTGGGATRSTISSAAGAYAFPTLAAESYRLRVEVPGFTPSERTLSLLVGQNIVVDFQMQPANNATTVDVTSEITEIDVNSSQVGGNVDPGRMVNTPLNGRNWMELSLLVPGVTVNAVSTVPLGNGSQGRFQINVDGQQVTQNAAGTGFGQPQYSREAMSQFQVITNRFDATLGRSAQIQVNAQTKSGTNAFHGSGYGYFRKDSFNAADPIAQRVLPFKNQQFGGTFGGAIIKNRLFFFGAYEGERQPSTVVTTPQGFGGQRFEFANDFSTNTWLARVDWQVKDSQRFSFRYNKSTWRNPFGNVGGTAHPSQAAKQTRDNSSFFVNWNWAAAPTFVVEAKYGFNYFQWTNNPYVESPEFRFPGGITVGGAYNYPQVFNQKTSQARTDLYWMKGTHSVKFGGEYLSNNHTGLFQQNVRGLASPISAVPANLADIFPVWNEPAGWKLDQVAPLVSSYVQGFGDFDIDIPRNILGFWVQDDWKVSRRLTLNLGLRYDNDLGIWSTPALRSGVVPPRGGENRNFGPRVGFAWDVAGDRRTVVRGGGGLYFADIQANQVINQSIFNGESSLQVSVNKTASSAIDLNKPFGQYTGDDFLSGNAPSPTQNVQLLGPGAQTPYSAQLSIGIEREVRKAWTISGDFVYWRIYHDWIRQDQNIFYDPVTGFGRNPTTAGRPDTRFGQILLFTTPRAAGSIYAGGQFEITRRLGDRFQLGTAYTISKLKDSTNGAFGYPNNQYDLADEWGPSLDDQRHTLNFDGSARLPWGVQSSLFYHLGSGSAFASLAPGNPFNYVGTSNRTFANGTRVYIDPQYLYPSRAAGFTNVKRNSLRGNPIHRMDWRLSKSVPIPRIDENYRDLRGIQRPQLSELRDVSHQHGAEHLRTSGLQFESRVCRPHAAICGEVRFLVRLAKLLVLIGTALRASPTPDIWLARVEPVMSGPERRQYFQLSAEAEREAFRRVFWTSKTIRPEAYFERVLYVDSQFGSGQPGSGANTDQGRVYLALGPPTSISQLPSSRLLVPLEVWRYDHVPGLQISSEIQLLFFEARGAGFKKLYSPQLHTIRALILNNAGTRGAFPVNDIVTEGDLLSRLRLSPAEMEAVDTAMSVARGVRGSGSSEILFRVTNPAAMLRRDLREKVSSRLLTTGNRAKIATAQSRTSAGIPAIDITAQIAVRSAIGIDVNGVETAETRLDFVQPAMVTYRHRLYLLPGKWMISLLSDGQRTTFPLTVNPVSATDPETVTDLPSDGDGTQITYRVNLTADSQWVSIGRQYLRSGDSRRAGLCFSKALEIRRTPDALAGQGRFLALSSRLDEARTHLLEALALEPVHWEAMVALAGVTARFSDREKALEYFRQAQAIRPSGDIEAAIRELSRMAAQKQKWAEPL